MLYNLLISSDFNGKYDGQLVKYEIAIKENLTSIDPDKDVKIYTFDLRELEKQSILQEVKKEITSKVKNSRLNTSSSAVCWNCNSIGWQSNPSTGYSGYGGGGSGQGVTNDILINAGYGYLVPGYFKVLIDPCDNPHKCPQLEREKKLTTPIKTYNISDVKVPLGNGTTGSLNSYINYQLPGVYEIIQEYYGSFAFKEEHERKQLFISTFINYMFDLKNNNSSQFEYLSNNIEVKRAIFYFFEEDKLYEYSSRGPSFTGENKVFVKSFIDYHKNLTFEQKSFLDDNPELTKETFDFFKNNGGVTEENKIINNTFLDYLIANRKNALSSLSSYFPSRDQLIQQVKNAITKGITSTAAIMQKLYLRLESYSNKYPSTIIYSNQYIIDPIRNQVKPLVNFNVNTMGWGDLFNIWLFELNSSGIINFGNTANIITGNNIYNPATNAVKNFPKGEPSILPAIKTKLANRTFIVGSQPISGYFNYNVNAFYSTISNANIGIQMLGSYDINAKVSSISGNTAIVQFSITNTLGWESATRFVKNPNSNGGNLGIINDKPLGTGLHLGGNIKNTFTWTEILNF